MKISPTITRAFTKSAFTLQKHSPTLLTAAGIVGVVTAGVLAARATLKLEETVEEAKLRLEHAEVSQQNKNVAVVKNVASIVKLYAPSVTLGVASLVCIVSAQGILHKRNAALVVAYKGLEEAYNRYRERVVEEYGEEVDRDFHLGLRDKEITDENGKKVKTKTRVDEKAALGNYQFIFGPGNDNWTGVADHNEHFLRSQERYLNDRLDVKGIVFLNEVLERLGIEKTKAGQVTGWVRDDKGQGDGYISFGIQKIYDQHAAENGWMEVNHFFLDFNVDGVILGELRDDS